MDYFSLLQRLLQFRDVRDWKQFHDSKNLAIAISIEAAELNELSYGKIAQLLKKLIPNVFAKNWQMYCHSLFYSRKNMVWILLKL